MKRLALLALLAGCGSDDTDLPVVTPGAPVAGAAEATLDLPLGTPLAAFTARARLLTGVSRPDGRSSPFTQGFVPSAGVQTRPTVKTIWIHNGDHDLVLVKADLAYMADHVVADVEQALTSALGRDLTGQVVLATSHSHQSYGAWNAHRAYFLGGDRHHPEVDRRLVDTIVRTALAAWALREPVALGASWTRDWDPDDRVYRDRRGDNAQVVIEGWTDTAAHTGKDPWLHVLRVDTLDGEPLAVAFTFGIHGIAVGADSPMVSVEASGHVELAVQEQFDEPVVVLHLQGSGGDASPAGRGARFERLEDVGRNAVDPILAAWADTPTDPGPLAIETWAAHAPQDLETIRVRRDGAVDWRYATDRAQPDDRIVGEDGRLLSPFDEFRAPVGAVFCGETSALLPGGGTGSQVVPYSSCVLIDQIQPLLTATFDLPELPLPLPETTRARVGAVRLDPILTRDHDGTIANEGLVAGLFPGEPVALLGEQFRRAAAEVGPGRPWVIGYAQDHEGYLMLPEDWLAGGYEPSINQWGPLQGEYLLERIVEGARGRLGDEVHQPGELLGPHPQAFDRDPGPTGTPEPAPDAGTRVDTPPPSGLWTPDDLPVDLDVPERVPRVQGLVQLAWIGGDPRVDNPTITLERAVDGGWEPVTTRAGRPVTEAFPDILLAWTPEPLDVEDGPRTHRWWAAWQAVSHWHDPAGLPLGTYRLAVTGRTFTGDEAAWPWTTTPYALASEPFEVVPGALEARLDGAVLSVSLPGPDHGFRQVAPGGAAAGDNPPPGPLRITTADGSLEAEGTVVGGRREVILDAVPAGTLRIEDAHGNEVELVVPGG